MSINLLPAAPISGGKTPGVFTASTSDAQTNADASVFGAPGFAALFAASDTSTALSTSVETLQLLQISGVDSESPEAVTDIAVSENLRLATSVFAAAGLTFPVGVDSSFAGDVPSGVENLTSTTANADDISLLTEVVAGQSFAVQSDPDAAVIAESGEAQTEGHEATLLFSATTEGIPADSDLRPGSDLSSELQTDVYDADGSTAVDTIVSEDVLLPSETYEASNEVATVGLKKPWQDSSRLDPSDATAISVNAAVQNSTGLPTEQILTRQAEDQTIETDVSAADESPMLTDRLMKRASQGIRNFEQRILNSAFDSTTPAQRKSAPLPLEPNVSAITTESTAPLDTNSLAGQQTLLAATEPHGVGVTQAQPQKAAPLTTQVMTAVVSRLAQVDTSEPGTITIRLDPPELGEMTVRFRQADDGTHVRLEARDPVTTDMLAMRSDEIQRLLKGLDLEISRVDLRRGDSEPAAAGGENSSPQQRDERHRESDADSQRRPWENMRQRSRVAGSGRVQSRSSRRIRA